MVEINSESKLRNPKKLLKNMLSDLAGSRELAYRLFIRDLSAQYRQSFLGILWAFIPSIFTSIAFTLANQSNVVTFGKTDIPYPAYVIFGMIIYQTFIESINAPVNAVANAKVMLAKINFKREALIVSKFCEVLFNFFIKAILLIAVFIYYHIAVSWTIILIPFAVSVLVLFGLFIGLLLSPLSLLYKDISNTLTVVTGFFLYITPVFFPVPKEGSYARIVNYNPLTHFIEAIRNLAVYNIGYSFNSFFILCVVTVIGLFLSWLLFRLALPYAIERISS